jgi:Uma2 family endonuclease
MTVATSKHDAVEEYLAFERASQTKHEYYSGRIYAKAGASLRHNRVTRNLRRALGERLDGTPCEPLPNDMRVKTPGDLDTYPDAIIVCGEPQLEDANADALLNPAVLFEVLSPSTEACDHEKKFDLYQTIVTLKEYALVAQDWPAVYHYARREPGAKREVDSFFQMDQTLVLNSLDCSIPLAEIYRQVEFPAELRLHEPHSLQS